MSTQTAEKVSRLDIDVCKKDLFGEATTRVAIIRVGLPGEMTMIVANRAGCDQIIRFLKRVWCDVAWQPSVLICDKNVTTTCQSFVLAMAHRGVEIRYSS